MASEDDWLFDYVLQFLESEKFDSVVMDFIDDKCEVFDNEEENKFEYTTIHQEFKETVEALIVSNLGELGVSVEMFFEACEKGRFKRDINQAVIERMVAMDDFMTFKKIMVKRNMELQLEALKACSFEGVNYDDFIDRENSDEDYGFSAADEARMDKIIQDSIQELEMLHLQAEMEASEMERILAMSLALEEERLHLMQTEIEEMERNEGAYRATLEAKSSPGKVDVASSKNTADFNVADAKGSAGSSESSTCKDSKNQESTPVKLKPLKMKSEMKALPSIGAVKDVALELEEKRKQVDKQFKLNQDALQARKIQKEEVLAQATTSVKSKKELENAEAEARAAHMKAQRERIMLMKKREREEKVALEERNQKIQASESNEDDAKLEALRSIANKEAKGLSDEEIAAKQKLDESKRGAMRNALAARMKADLLSNLSSKSNGSADSQKFADLDAKIAEMDLLREENMRKEQDLTKTITSTLSQKNKS